jgi:3-methylcrotonyl-CoA carboxylase alpha subunit
VFKSLLVANRGEIAVRVMQTARRLGMRAVAVYSEADRDALHVRVADEAVLIGPADARRSYLDVDRIVAAAKETGAEAIHPGYGFLSENAAFAEACAAEGLVFVGPPPAAIRAMGSKAEAKALLERAGVPVVPGYHGDMQDAAFLKRKAYEIGYPVLVKAAAGGGGKGMRRVDKALAFEEALESAKREAAAAFGDDRVLVEKFVANPRHVEIQVFADGHGRTVSLHERDCSVQRRHQKVMEEAPAPGMTPELRAAMGEAAVRAAEAVGYVGAGTVEFIAEGGETLSPDRFFFMEMNTRLQVEHPVTEAVTGIDLVEWQLRVAAGEPLPLDGPPPGPDGHAVEVRLYAEDPDAGFLPSAGRLAVFRVPEGVRVDAGVEAGDTVSPHYDPMIAKLVVHAADRQAALAAMADALGRTVAIGPKTNLPFLGAVVTHPDVLAGRHDTGFVDRESAALTGGSVSAEAVADAVATLVPAPPSPPADEWVDPFAVHDGFRITGEAVAGLAVSVDGAERVARVAAGPEGLAVSVDGIVGQAGSHRVVRSGGEAFAVEAGRAVRVALVDQLARRLADEAGPGRATAPMHGRIVAIHVHEGDVVERGAPLFAVEAMKMEHTVKAPAAARVVKVRVAAGDQVGQGDEVVVLAADDAGQSAGGGSAAASTETGGQAGLGLRADNGDHLGPAAEATTIDPANEAATGSTGAATDAVEEQSPADPAPSARDDPSALAAGVAAAAAQVLASSTKANEGSSGAADPAGAQPPADKGNGPIHHTGEDEKG